MRRLVTIAVALSLAFVTVPTAVSQSANPVAEDEGWRAVYWDHNEEPNVPGLDYDDSGTVGDHPKDIPLDADSSKMWDSPNQERTEKIYFDQGVHNLEGPRIANPQTDDTQPQTQLFTSYFAHLGFWRDCNGDGYVGSAITGGQWYSVDQLREESALNGFDWSEVCPLPDEGDDADYMYNDGKQVRELIPIGPGARDADPQTSSLAEDDVTCPSKDDGPSDNADTGRSGTERTSEDDAFLNGGDNVACTQEGSQFFVQDDYVRVGLHLGSPVDLSKVTSSIIPPPDGWTTDSNGLFWWMDNQNLGALSAEFPGLWPSARETGQHSDNDRDHSANDWKPRPGNQCVEHGDPTGDTGQGTTGIAAADNAEAFANDNPPGEVVENTVNADDPEDEDTWAGDHSDLWKTRDTKIASCSPVPNMQYIDVDNSDDTHIERFAWPLHIAEERWTNADRQGEEPRAITDPYACDGDQAGGVAGSGIDGNPDEWSDDDSDGPVTDADEPYKYYGPHQDGASANPIVTGTLNMLAVHDPTNPDATCEEDNGEFFTLSTKDPGGSGMGKRASISYDTGSGSTFFNEGSCVNPAKSPGDAGTVDTSTAVCPNSGMVEDGEAAQKAEYAYWDSVNFIDVPNEKPLHFWSLRTINSTMYADVSFGQIVADDDANCDYPFDPAGDDGGASAGTCFPTNSSAAADDDRGGVFDAGPLFDPATDDPADVLPGDGDNAHQIGDYQCGGSTAPSITPITKLGTNGQDHFVGGEEDGLNKWICDRQAWFDRATRDCGLTLDRTHPNVEQTCYLSFDVGDPFDLWDIECSDGETAGDRTIQKEAGNRNCEDYDEQLTGNPGYS